MKPVRERRAADAVNCLYKSRGEDPGGRSCYDLMRMLDGTWIGFGDWHGTEKATGMGTDSIERRWNLLEMHSDG